MNEPANSGDIDWPNRADQIARKYFFIWIWSIVVGITTTIAISLVNYFPRSRGLELVALVGPLYLASSMSILAALFGVLRYLTSFIIPVLADRRPDNEFLSAQRYLIRAVQFSMLAMAFRLMLAIADLALGSVPFG